jgi:capsular polysaccharide biosynthesis protein
MNKLFALKQKIKNVKLHMTLQIFVVGVVLSLTFFLLMLDSFKTYSSELSILVVPKSNFALQQQDQLVSNILEFPKTLAFYDALLKHNSDVKDQVKGLSADERKNYWNGMLSVNRSSINSSVIRITVTTKNKNDAEKLDQKTVRELFNTASVYYDIKNDFDLRIIDGPIIKTYLPAWQMLLFISALLGFFLVLLLDFVIFGKRVHVVSQENELGKNKDYFDFKHEDKTEAEVENYFSQNHFLDVEKENAGIQQMKKLTKLIEPDKYPNFPEMPTVLEKRDAAPGNLPIADDDFELGSFENQENATEEILMPEVEAPVIEQERAEPTPEQLKKRLNELLRGEF